MNVSPATIKLKILDNGSSNNSAKLNFEEVRLVDHEIMPVTRNTTEYWNTQTGYVPKVNEIVVYTDHSTIVQDGVTKNVPGIKIGDGNAYVVDLPFIDDALGQKLLEHAENQFIHVTSAERRFWNNKFNFSIDGEQLIFNRL